MDQLFLAAVLHLACFILVFIFLVSKEPGRGSRILMMLFFPLLISMILGGVIFAAFSPSFSVRYLVSGAGYSAGYVFVPHVLYILIYIVYDFTAFKKPATTGGKSQ